jgi:hypothetical protein
LHLASASLDEKLIVFELLLRCFWFEVEMQITYKLSAELSHVFVLADHADLPQSIHPLDLLERSDAGNPLATFVHDKRLVFCVDTHEQGLEAFVSLQVEVLTVHGPVIAHDLGEHLELQFLVQQEHSLSSFGVLVLFSQEVEELLGLNWSDGLGNEYFEEFLDMVELKSN